MVDTLAIWSDDQYFCNLISWSIRWKFDWMFNTLEILSNDRFHQVDMIQIILWFALGRDLLICDLNMFDVEKLLLIMMCDTSQCDWDIKIESICDNQRAKFYPLEASATHDKVARSFSSLVIFQYFFTVATPLLKCRADFCQRQRCPPDQSQLNLKPILTQTIPLQLQLPTLKLKVLLLNIYILILRLTGQNSFCIFVNLTGWFEDIILFEIHQSTS